MSSKTLGLLLGAVLFFLVVGCADNTGPSEPQYVPDYAKTCNDGGGDEGGRPCVTGGGGGGTVCTIATSNYDPTCGKKLAHIGAGIITGLIGCRRSVAACITTWDWGTNAIDDWRNTPDPWYTPWWEHGQQDGPPGVGGTFPIPIGGF